MPRVGYLGSCPLSGFSRVSEEVEFRGSLVTAGRATIRDPSGATFERDLVHHPGAVVVVPVVDDGRSVLMVRQYRAAIDRVLLEIPAGRRDVAGEAVELTARRELIEEVGMEAGRLEKLAEFFNSPGFCDEHSWLFLATDLTPCPGLEGGSPQGIEEEHMTVEVVAFDAVPAMIAGGLLIDAKTILGLALARYAVDRQVLDRHAPDRQTRDPGASGSS